MKTIIVTVSVEPKRSVKSRLFGLVEGERFRYRATVKNVGDEPVGSKDQDPDGRVTNLAAIEFVWAFPTGQVVVRRFPFPDNLASNTSHTFPEVDHDILSSGFALLSARLWWTGTGLNLAVQDSAGRNVPIPDSLESVYLREWGVRASTVFLARSFGSFRAKSRGEVYQSILLLIATVALLVNTFVAAYSILR